MQRKVMRCRTRVTFRLPQPHSLIHTRRTYTHTHEGIGEVLHMIITFIIRENVLVGFIPKVQPGGAQ